MLKALIKKQLEEVFSFIFIDRRKGIRRTSAGAIGFGALFALLFIFMGVNFYTVASSLCPALAALCYDWVYFALMGLMALMIGLFGSVFSTYASLYMAKDNDLLFALPVKPRHVLFSRLIGVYLTGLMYELIVMIPTVIAYFVYKKPGALSVVFTLLVPVVLSFIILSLSCILGWVIAAISRRTQEKTLVTVLLSLGFIGVYYYFYSQAYSILQRILADPESMAKRLKAYVYPLYRMGLGASGDVVSMLIFTGIAIALMLIVYSVVARSFLKLTISGSSAPVRSKAKYSDKAIVSGSVSGALLRKEAMRFASSANYIMNCGLGTLFIVAAAAALFIKGGDLIAVLTSIGVNKRLLSILVCAGACMLTTMNSYTAPSVSLEGKQIYILQSLPVEPRRALEAKLKMQLLMTLIPAALLAAAIEIVVKPALMEAVLIPLVIFAYVAFMAEAGLWLNLKAPNLHWTNEVVPIKQSMPVAVSLFGGWALAIALGAIYLLVGKWLNSALYLCIVFALLTAGTYLLFRWISTRGAKIFSELD